MSKKNKAIERVLLVDGFDQPHEVSDAARAFGGDMKTLLPPYSLIPDEFKDDHNEWAQFQAAWFFGGFPKSGLVRRPDVDADAAFKHLATIQGSWEPKHEHKQAAVAWLASRWFKAIA